MDAKTVAGADGCRKSACRSRRAACRDGKKRKTHGCGDESDDSCRDSACHVVATTGRLGKGGTACTQHIGEQLNRVEELLQRLLHRRHDADGATHVSGELPQSPPPTASEQKDKGTSKFKMSSSPPPSPSSWSSLIPNGGHGGHDGQSIAYPGLSSTCDNTQRRLVALLPCQHDADIIFESSNGWMILDGIYQAPLDMYVNRDRQSYALDMAVVAQARPVLVARTLLHLAICMNGLPPDFDVSRLSGVWSLEATMREYVTTVMTLVTGSDQQMMTLHGLETLFLLGIYHTNEASLRQAWLTVRRGLSLAYLMGIHRIITQEDMSPPSPARLRAKGIWRNFVDLDQYLGIHLRLPFGADDYPVPDNADAYLVHRSRINKLSRQIAELGPTASPQGYATALALDEALEQAMKEMPRAFWEVPDVTATARSPESHALLQRLLAHMWHFELKIFLHVPYLLQAGQQSRYEYSRVTALQASRSLVMRWFALRRANMTQACCRLGEVGVYVAGVTLLLDILVAVAGCGSTGAVQREKGSDFAMVRRLVGEMEALARLSAREKMAGRSAAVLRKMAAVLEPERLGGHEDGMRLALPFFGTLHIEHGKRPAGFSFLQDSLWPKALLGDEGDEDWGVVVFDGLEDRQV